MDCRSRIGQKTMTTASIAAMTSLGSLSTEDFLSVVGQRVRRRRTALRMSRKRLAETSGVSERYLAQLEAGQGNMSIALLRKVTIAMALPLGELMAEERNQMPEPEERGRTTVTS